jgi:hypothetical protein
LHDAEHISGKSYPDQQKQIDYQIKKIELHSPISPALKNELEAETVQ